jgi:type IV pilus assembly protein PilV
MSIKTRKKNINKKPSGFTLIEVMIALVILATGLLALMTMQIVAIRANAFSSEMTYASMLAQSRLEQIRNMTYANITPGTVTDTVSASDATKGTAYDVETKVEDNTPATDMKTVTLTVNWKGSPAGSSTGEHTVDFKTSFITIITR